MRNAVEGIGYQEFDMAGEIIESIKLDVDMKRRNQNDEAFMKLLGVCNAPQVISSVSPLVETQVFQNVPAKASWISFPNTDRAIEIHSSVPLS